MKAKTNKEKKKGTVATLVKSAAKELAAPSLQKIATEIQADDQKYIPQYQGTFAVVKTTQGATLPYRATTSLDCGFSFKLPLGWKVTINAMPVWANKGLIITNPGVCSDGRMKVYVTNVGKQIVVINPDDDIAQITLDPVYMFDWITNA